MSVRVMATVWADSEHSGGKLLLLLALADHANDQGVCWPSLETLAQKSRMSERHVRRLLRELEESGELRTEVGGNTDGQNRSSVYRIVPLNRADKMSGEAPGGDISSGGADADVREGGTPMSPEPSKEPSVETSELPSATQGAADTEPQLFEAPPAVQPAKPSDNLDPLVEKVWAHYLAVFGDRPRMNPVLTPPRKATLQGGLKALGVDEDPTAAVEMACRAITGCRDYRRDHPDQTQDVSVDAIFKTHPGTKYNRTDFIMRWANYANATVLASDSSVRVPVDLVGVPSVTAGTIRARRREVAQMYDHPGSAEAKERGEVAVDWLREHVGHQPKIVDGELRGWELIP